MVDHPENPDWYYTEDGRYQSCLGALLRGGQHTWRGIYVSSHARASFASCFLTGVGKIGIRDTI